MEKEKETFDFSLVKAKWKREAEERVEQANRRRRALQDLIPVLERFGVKRAYVFGSTARGKAWEGSDIDIYVEPHVGDRFWDLWRELRKATDFEIDLHDSGDEDFVRLVKTQGECFYERK